MKRPSFNDARVAFIILTWNSEKYVRACLDSVLGLACRELDVYIEENGSTDGTRAILERYDDMCPNVHVSYRTNNDGTTVPRNHALRYAIAGTDYICILDSDTVVNQAAFEIMTNTLAEHPSLGVVGPTMVNSAGSKQLSGRNFPTFTIKLAKVIPVGAVRRWAENAEVPTSELSQGIQKVGYLLSACWLVSSSVFAEVGLFDESIFYAPEDVDWCLRCWKAGFQVAFVPRARIIHEYQRLSHQKLFSHTNLEHIKGLAYYYRKHRYLLRVPKLLN